MIFDGLKIRNFKYGVDMLKTQGCPEKKIKNTIYHRVIGFRAIIDFQIQRLTVLTLHSYDDWNFQRMAS